MNKEKRERRNNIYQANVKKRGEITNKLTINKAIPSKKPRTLFWTEAGLSAKNANKANKIATKVIYIDQNGIEHTRYVARHPKLNDLKFVKKEVKVETNEEMKAKFAVKKAEKAVAFENREYKSLIKESISTVVRRDRQRAFNEQHEEQIKRIIDNIREQKTYSKNKNNFAVIVSMNNSKGLPYDFSTTYSAHDLKRTQLIAKNLHEKMMSTTEDYYGIRIIPIAEYNKPANGMYAMPVFTLLNNSQNEQRAAA